jgi:hypothetical protein
LDGGEGTRAQKDNETLKGETAALKAEVMHAHTLYYSRYYCVYYAVDTILLYLRYLLDELKKSALAHCLLSSMCCVASHFLECELADVAGSAILHDRI